MTLLLLALVAVACFGLGFATHKVYAISYKERWQLATRRIEQLEAGDTPKALGPNPEQLRAITKRHDYSRDQTEKNRLKSGLPPIDPLTGLNDHYYNVMVKRRFGYGYDEGGRKVK